MKSGLSQKASDIFVVIYILITLYVRFLLEPQLGGHILISIGIGLFALLFLWALSKSKIINPSWFGLLGKKK
ncbi:MAG: hypothetical protein OQJ81_00255 [Melioribacteraceae bacterium]|nr:hypothetical protein [Melioribacteraceae bacterium]